MADNAQVVADEPKRNRVLEFGAKHPYILTAVVVLLIILVVFFMLKDTCWPKNKKNAKKKKQDAGDSAETTQIDELIESINRKQAGKAAPDDE